MGLPAWPAESTATTAPAQPAANRFTYEGVSFDLDPAIATGANGQIVTEKQGSTDGPYWDANPRYPNIILRGYPITQSAFQPIIAVYPVEDFRRLSPPAAQIIDQLQNLLAQKPADQERIPLLPVWNAAQVFHSNMQYVNFQNGSGVRYLTLYAQYPAPINNKDLFYTFQGLTSDGRYYISAILPINQSSLPASAEAVSQADKEAQAKNSTYYPNIASTLSAQPTNGFTPDLSKLDALITSLSIGK